jgi:hypothetical protein
MAARVVERYAFMKITINGKEFEGEDYQVEFLNSFADDWLKPLKKTEKKEEYMIQTWQPGIVNVDYRNELKLTETTALKLSEAISALVEYVTNPVKVNQAPPSYEADFQILENSAIEARKSFQESQ